MWEKEKISVTERIVLLPIYILFSYKGASYTDPCYDNIFSNFVITNDTEYTIKIRVLNRALNIPSQSAEKEKRVQ